MHKPSQTHLHIKVVRKKKPSMLIWYPHVKFEKLFWTAEIAMNLTPGRRAKLIDSTAYFGNLKRTLTSNLP